MGWNHSAATAVAYGLELARRSPIEVHLLHVQSSRPTTAVPIDHTEAAPGAGDAVAETRRRLEEMVPADLVERVECHVEAGSPADGIMAEAK